MGFTLEFHFETNPYFTNTVLSKTYETANLLDHVSVQTISSHCTFDLF
jgi:Nucleosome assembly protein (NAP)